MIDDTGMLYGVWSDDLIELYQIETSHIEVERASHVEFCHSTNRWYVYETDGVTLMYTGCGLMWPNCEGFTTRASALAWEKQEIERRLQEGDI